MIRKRVTSMLAAFVTFAAPALGDEVKQAPKPDTTIQNPQTPPVIPPNLESLGDPDKFCPAEKPEDKPKEKPPVPMC